MPSLRVGQTEIAYELRRTATAAERRITVTPGYVEVLALTTDDDAAIESFLDRKRQWLFETIRELEEQTATQHAVPRFMTGSKIPFRGRMSSLTVRRHDGVGVEVTHKTGFLVDLPSWVEAEAADAIVAMHIKLWLKRQVRQDVNVIAAAYRKRHGLQPRAIRVTDMKSGWGSCGAEGAIHINWHLVFAPKRVLEYVVVHELAHLKHRSHGEAFWAFLASILPDYQSAKTWLDRHQASLDSGFLDAPARRAASARCKLEVTHSSLTGPLPA
jgi:predicted metal-dependent hydrolase